MRYFTLTKIVLFSVLLLPNITLAQTEPESRYFDSNGVKIRYIELGVGEPVIAVHGFSRNSETWLKRVSDLAENHRLILFDARGHGLSDKPHTVSKYGKEMGRDIVRLMDHLEIDKTHIVGYSLGTWLVSWAITENESRFISVVLGGGVPRWEWGNAQDRLSQQTYTRLINSSARQMAQFGNEGLDQIALANVRLGQKDMIVTKQSLSDLKIPVLAIVGSEDPALEGIQNFKNTFPFIELDVVEGGTHLSTPERPEFLESIQEFITRNSEN
jgi:pimeloyl-ACP methyl ester carboxylesterase